MHRRRWAVLRDVVETIVRVGMVLRAGKHLRYDAVGNGQLQRVERLHVAGRCVRLSDFSFVPKSHGMVVCWIGTAALDSISIAGAHQ
jgi:hypothetical protein